MPAELSNVNLLGHDPVEESPIGRLVTWATTYGRYIMVLTEVVVLLAFLSRFTLDRKLTDLNEAIDQKKAIIEANLPFETEIESIHKRIAEVKSIIAEQEAENSLLSSMKTLLPPDVYLKKLDVAADTVSIDAVAGSTGGFAQFIANLQFDPKFTDISIKQLKKDPNEGIIFSAVMDTARPKPVAAAEPADNPEPGTENQ